MEQFSCSRKFNNNVNFPQRKQNKQKKYDKVYTTTEIYARKKQKKEKNKTLKKNRDSKKYRTYIYSNILLRDGKRLYDTFDERSNYDTQYMGQTEYNTFLYVLSIIDEHYRQKDRDYIEQMGICLSSPIQDMAERAEIRETKKTCKPQNLAPNPESVIHSTATGHCTGHCDTCQKPCLLKNYMYESSEYIEDGIDRRCVEHDFSEWDIIFQQPLYESDGEY